MKIRQVVDVIRIVGDTIVSGADVVALLNREPVNPTAQRQFEEGIDDLNYDADIVALLSDIKDDLLNHKQEGWVRVSAIEEVLCKWSEKYE